MQGLWTLVVAGLFGLQQAAPPAVSEGKTIVTSYRDAATGVTYGFPSGFVSRPEASAAIAQGLANMPTDDAEEAKRAKCVSIPLLLRSQTAATDEIGLILMMRVDHRCVGEPGTADELGAQAQSLTKMLREFGVPATEDAMDYRLDGHAAAFVKGSSDAKMLGGGGKRMHVASVCTLVGTNTLCWLMLDSNDRAMPGLVASPVTFDGRAAVPLVPKEMVDAW